MSFIPNSFQLPNSLIDNGYMAKMKGASLPCYLFIVRKTRGWNKSQDYISTSQLIDGTGYKKDAVLGGINQLIEMGIVRKISFQNKPSKYTLTDAVVAVEKTASDISAIGNTDTAVGNTDSNLSEIPTHNNNIKTTNTKTIDICSEPAKKTRSVSEKSKKFSFEKSLLKLGANKQFVSEFMEVRKAKRAVDSETAFKRFISEQQKSGKSLDEVLELCIVNSWKSFNASWNQPPAAKQQPEAPKRRFGNHFNGQQPQPMRDVGGYHE